MKIALCLYGRVGTSKGKTLFQRDDDLDPSISHFFFNKNIFENYDADVFIHTWSTSNKNKLNILYKPKKIIAEKQKFFFPLKSLIKEFRNVVSIKQKLVWLYNLFFTYNYGKNKNFKRLQATYSRFYSAYKSIKLKKNYEEENNFKYDYVISARIDLCLFKKIEFEKLSKKILYCPNSVKFRDKLTKNKEDIELLYKRKDQVHDEFFISSSEIMDRFSKIYFDLPNLRATNHFAPYDFITTNHLKLEKFFHINYEHTVLRILVNNKLDKNLSQLLK